MPITIANVSFHKSLAEDAGIQSLGGGIGAAIASQIALQPTVVTGVYIAQAFGNATGWGSLAYNPTTQQIWWKPPGSATTYYSPVIGASGSYTVGGTTDGLLVLTVTFASLPTIFKTESIEISSPIGTVFSQVNTTMALIGDEQYRCLYFKNNHSSLPANDVRLYLHAPPLLPQTITLGLDPAGPGDGITTGVAQSIADAHTPPVGVTFSAPTQAASGISLGVLAPGQCVAFWQKRTVPPMSYGPLAIAQATIGVVLVG